MRRLNKNYSFLIIAALLVLGVSFISRSAVPLYDGVGFPDEPYRYIEPPKPSLKTPKAAGVASGTFATNNLTDGLDINSGEYFPQISIYLDSSAVDYPSSATSLTITATPQAAASDPSGWTIDSNVYHFTGTTDSGTLVIKAHSIDAHHYRTIDMRLPQGYAPYPTFWYQPLNESGWQQLQTFKVGTDIYEAVIVNFGNYALAHKNTSPAVTVTKKSSSYVIQYVIAFILVAIAAVIFVIRSREKNKPKNKKKKK